MCGEVDTVEGVALAIRRVGAEARGPPVCQLWNKIWKYKSINKKSISVLRKIYIKKKTRLMFYETHVCNKQLAQLSQIGFKRDKHQSRRSTLADANETSKRYDAVRNVFIKPCCKNSNPLSRAFASTRAALHKRNERAFQSSRMDNGYEHETSTPLHHSLVAPLN